MSMRVSAAVAAIAASLGMDLGHKPRGSIPVAKRRSVVRKRNKVARASRRANR